RSTPAQPAPWSCTSGAADTPEESVALNAERVPHERVHVGVEAVETAMDALDLGAEDAHEHRRHECEHAEQRGGEDADERPDLRFVHADHPPILARTAPGCQGFDAHMAAVCAGCGEPALGRCRAGADHAACAIQRPERMRQPSVTSRASMNTPKK